MKKNNRLKFILYILNPLALIAIVNAIFVDKLPIINTYSVTILILSVVFSIFLSKKHKKWLEIIYFSVYVLFFVICLISFPLGLAFALTGGIYLAFEIVFLIYLPILLLVIANGMQIFGKKNNEIQPKIN